MILRSRQSGDWRLIDRDCGLLHELLGVSQLRNPLRVNEGSHFDVAQPRSNQEADEFRLFLGPHNFRFILQAVSRSDFQNVNLRRQ